MRVAVIGAGPAGLTAAYQLRRMGAEVALFEAGAEVGGMARSLDLWGQRVDLGPHRFFSRDERINRFWHDCIGPDYRMVERRTRIFYRGRLFDYPLRPWNVLANLGPVDSLRCLASYAARVLPGAGGGAADSFESWVVRRFGRRLFEIFFKSYSEKLWGIPCDQLDADFAAQRIRGFSLGHSLLAMAGVGRRRHKTLVDRFAYPKAGSGELYRRIADRFVALGGGLHLGTPVAGVVAAAGRVTGVRLTDGRVEPFDHVVSTMPLTALVRGLGADAAHLAEPLARLRFRNTILVFLNVASARLFPDQWIYVHAPEVAVGRITNFRNWVPELYGSATSSVLSLEYWCYDDDAVWRHDDATLIDRARTELATLGLASEAAVSAGHVERLPRCYPVYARGYRAALAPVIEYLRGLPNLWPIGRYGAFKYNNQDHSILMGLLVAENIAGGGRHDLWAVNTDYDDYQEAGRAEDTGPAREAVA